MRIHRPRNESGPANRFETVRQEQDWEQLASDDELLSDERRLPTVFLPDNAQTIIRENDSPDVGFRFSIKSLSRLRARLCLLLCASGPRNAGYECGDRAFETKVLVKHDAVALVRKGADIIRVGDASRS